MFKSFRRFRKRLKGFVLSLVVLVAAAGGAGYYWITTSLPDLSGDIRLAGLSGDVEVIYDEDGIPHIHAASPDDAYRALGFVHARDRLFQMDFMRRLGAGRLAEVLGRQAVGIDRTMRTLGIYRLAERSFARLPDEVKRCLQDYADGVNAFLETRSGALPPEFVALGYRPEKWRPADSLVWGRLMALRLSGNRRTEALRMALSDRLSADRIGDLWPRGDDERTPPTVAWPADSRAGMAPMFARLLDALPDALRRISDSNSWAVGGSDTASGRPLLANDPHLGFRAPVTWYLARIEAPGLDLTGATAPGVPFLVLGHNDRIAWAFTSTESDTQDLFVERLSKGDSGDYDTPDGPRPFTERTETIRVKDSAPVKVRIRETRHGPVISDLGDDLAALAGKDRVVALSATALRPDDMTALALYGIDRARDWASFRDALRNFDAPQQNITYADVDGNIGFVAAGRVPVRASGDGSVPVPGWSGAYDWTGFVPFAELPQTFNPDSGRIVNANNRVVPPSYPWLLTRDWPPPYRARRIHELLDAEGPQSLATTADLQNDVLSEAANAVLPALLARAAPSDERGRRALGLLRGWNREMRRDRAAPLIFTAWLREVNRGLYADELGPVFPAYFDLHPRVVLHMLNQRPAWCDVVTTPETESCGDVVTRALGRALDGLADKYGRRLSGWKWGDAHRALFSHPVFTHIALLRDLANISIETDGGAFTVNRGLSRVADADAPFASVHGPGFRAIYDLSNLGNSRFALATGESGNPLSPRYDNLLHRWRDGVYVRIARTRENARRGAMGVLRLQAAR